MEKDNLPLEDHNPIIAKIPGNPLVEFRWNGPLQGYTKCLVGYLQKLSK